MAIFWYFYFRRIWLRPYIFRILAALDKPSKAQWDRILGVAIGTPVLVAILWCFGVMAEQAQLQNIREKVAVAKDKLTSSETVRRQVGESARKLQERGDLLARREAFLAPNRDTYAWIVSTINSFSDLHRGVKIDGYSLPEVSAAGILPNFPYRWATFHLRGTGYYHEFGSFFADLENTFPYYRIQNVVIAPNTKPAAEPETLSFNFDLVIPMVASDTK